MTDQPTTRQPSVADLAPVVPGAPVVKRTERPHPVTPLIRGWIVLVAIVIAVGRQLVPDGRPRGDLEGSELHWIAPVLGAAVLLAALASFVSWYFTHFVIDDDELRVETGAVFRTSTKVSFERLQSIDVIQPLAARPFGLVELRLEAGVGDHAIKLRYLTRAKADRLRSYLLARAHGERRTVAAPDGPPPSSFTDLSAAHTPLVTVSSGRLVGGFLLSSDWLVTVLVVRGGLTVSSALGIIGYVLPSIIPLLIGAVTLISRRVISMFHFTLAESEHGLRVARGLTNLTSQSIPVDRVQGIKISQSLLWRIYGWYRVDVDIVGYGAASDENNKSEATSVLLPVADAAEVALALRRVLPDFDPSGVELRRPPSRAGWVRWFDFWTLRYGWDDRAIITEHGWLTHVRDLVPHGKTQTVRVEQGPLQKRLRLASVHIDIAKGPVQLIARQLDPAVARDLAVTQLDRMRVARRSTD